MNDDRQNVVVAGGAGFLGSHLCERLLSEGRRVVCVDDFSTGNPDNIAQLLTDERFRLVKQDICAGLEIDSPVDAIVHLASPASPQDYLRLPVETLRVGSAGTLATLELARRTGARLVYASSSEVYGDPLVHPQDETYWGNVNPLGPRSVYDESKRFGEAAVSAYVREHGVDACIVRLFNTYGPRMKPDDGRMVPNFVVQALEGKPLTIYGSGRQTRSLCYVSDTVEALLRAVGSDHPGPMNLGNPVEMTVLEVAELIRDLTGSTSEITFLPGMQDDPQLRRPEIGLARQVLGWQPEVALRHGLAEVISSFRDVRAARLPSSGHP
ncbi:MULTISPECIES: UDP-glucuronic acid decarboxylase family protein [Streptomyces]|uniref:UDP-glucuronic acid decarboxylase family protein n=1 Tax=Streptomyces TaxID=1883 RepID=UPI000CD5149C|nr:MULTISPECIES: UDP-glucuronic acid decarboxylase family protein [Streptomyces]MCX4712983.1 SDR family oxidoreductase [Streptomyces griseus]QXR01755.1 SDR family oxidoreductase [Streptomyces sp. WY228]